MKTLALTKLQDLLIQADMLLTGVNRETAERTLRTQPHAGNDRVFTESGSNYQLSKPGWLYFCAASRKVRLSLYTHDRLKSIWTSENLIAFRDQLNRAALEVFVEGCLV